MTHPRHARFLSLLQGYAVAKGIKHKTKLADHLEVDPRNMHHWLKRTMPVQRNLNYLAEKTGIAEIRTLRSS